MPSSTAVLDRPVSYDDDISELTVIRGPARFAVNKHKELTQWEDLEEAIHSTGIKTIRVTTQAQLNEVLELDQDLKKELTVRTNNESIKQSLREAVAKGHVERAQQVLGRKTSTILAQQQGVPPWQEKEASNQNEKEQFAEWIQKTRARLEKGERVDAKIESLEGVRAHAKDFVQLLKDYPDRKQLHVRATDNIAIDLSGILEKAQKDLRMQLAIREKFRSTMKAPEASVTAPVATMPAKAHAPAVPQTHSLFTRATSAIKNLWPWGRKKAS